MSKYAEGTKVPAQRSRDEIEHTLSRFGADQFMYASKDDAAVIAFRAHGRHIRFLLPLPKPGRQKDEQEIRRRWRSLAMCVKSKLDAITSGIETFEEAFLAHVVLPNGATLAEHAQPLLEQMHKDGKMPPLLSFQGAS